MVGTILNTHGWLATTNLGSSMVVYLRNGCRDGWMGGKKERKTDNIQTAGFTGASLDGLHLARLLCCDG
jgi:hypothetical protein